MPDALVSKGNSLEESRDLSEKNMGELSEFDLKEAAKSIRGVLLFLFTALFFIHGLDSNDNDMLPGIMAVVGLMVYVFLSELNEAFKDPLAKVPIWKADVPAKLRSLLKIPFAVLKSLLVLGVAVSFFMGVGFYAGYFVSSVILAIIFNAVLFYDDLKKLFMNAKQFIANG